MPKLDIEQILLDYLVIAVVGISDKSGRASYKVAQYLRAQGYDVLGVNPLLAGMHVDGIPCFADLAQAAQFRHIDIVDCFRKSEEMPALAQQAIAIGAKCLWMQLDIENPDAAALAQSAGLSVVMNRCIKIEHQRINKPALI